MSGLRPAVVCRRLVAALEASEGGRRRRKRDTSPDAIGLGIKRALLEAVVAEDPDPAAFEGWLLARCLEPKDGASVGAMRAMALDVLGEWRLAAWPVTLKSGSIAARRRMTQAPVDNP